MKLVDAVLLFGTCSNRYVTVHHAFYLDRQKERFLTALHCSETELATWARKEQFSRSKWESLYGPEGFRVLYGSALDGMKRQPGRFAGVPVRDLGTFQWLKQYAATVRMEIAAFSGSLVETSHRGLLIVEPGAMEGLDGFPTAGMTVRTTALLR